MVKNLPANVGNKRPLGREDPLEEGMTILSSILPGKFPGQRSLAGYSPWGRKESHNKYESMVA